MVVVEAGDSGIVSGREGVEEHQGDALGSLVGLGGARVGWSGLARKRAERRCSGRS